MFKICSKIYCIMLRLMKARVVLYAGIRIDNTIGRYCGMAVDYNYFCRNYCSVHITVEAFRNRAAGQ